MNYPADITTEILEKTGLGRIGYSFRAGTVYCYIMHSVNDGPARIIGRVKMENARLKFAKCEEKNDHRGKPARSYSIYIAVELNDPNFLNVIKDECINLRFESRILC